jgi:Virulence factor BrkB
MPLRELNSEQGLTRVRFQRQPPIVFAPEASYGFPLKDGGVTKLAARNKIVSNQPGRLTSHRGASGIWPIAANASEPKGGILAAAFGIIVALFGASGVFGQLQDALNTIWGVKAKPGGGIWGSLRARFLSFAMVGGVCFLLLVSLTVESVFTDHIATLDLLFCPDPALRRRVHSSLQQYLWLTCEAAEARNHGGEKRNRGAGESCELLIRPPEEPSTESGMRKTAKLLAFCYSVSVDG